MKKLWHIELSPAALDLAALQRTVVRRPGLAYSQLIDYDVALMRPHLPEKAERILDVGSGIAGIDVRLHQIYPDAHFYLLDSTGNDIKYGLETEQVFYNSQAAAENLLISNDVPVEQIHSLEATPDYEIDIDGIDLAISLFSWGWHYPLGTYAKAVAKVIVPGGTLIVDVRNEEGKELLEETFELISWVTLQDGHRCFYRRI